MDFTSQPKPTIEYVCGFLFSTIHDNATLSREVVLIKKTKGPEINVGKLNGVGGKRESMETFEEAMSREFGEEAGIYIPPNRWTPYFWLYGEGWCVKFMVAYTSSDHLHRARTMEEEEIFILEVDRVITGKEATPLAENLYWLIPMALHMEESDGSILHERIPEAAMPEAGSGE